MHETMLRWVGHKHRKAIEGYWNWYIFQKIISFSTLTISHWKGTHATNLSLQTPYSSQQPTV